MGFFYSNNGRECTSTLDVKPTTFLTQKGEQDTKAAIIIQRWWRKRREQNIYEHYTTNSSCIRLRHKRKHEDIESNIAEYSYTDIDTDLDTGIDTDLDTDLDVEEINSSEFSESESESENVGEVQTIVYNNFFLDLWLSFYTFILRFFGM